MSITPLGSPVVPVVYTSAATGESPGRGSGSGAEEKSSGEQATVPQPRSGSAAASWRAACAAASRRVVGQEEAADRAAVVADGIDLARREPRVHVDDPGAEGSHREEQRHHGGAVLAHDHHAVPGAHAAPAQRLGEHGACRLEVAPRALPAGIHEGDRVGTALGPVGGNAIESLHRGQDGAAAGRATGRRRARAARRGPRRWTGVSASSRSRSGCGIGSVRTKACRSSRVMPPLPRVSSFSFS